MKKLFFVILAIIFLAGPVEVAASDDEIICPQPYGGGVVCGVKTHAPVNTGLGDNWGAIGAGLLVSSAFIVILSKKFKTSQA